MKSKSIKKQEDKIQVVAMPPLETIAKDFVEKFTHDQLLAALYWCFDAFDRANMQFFVVKDTAKKVKTNKLLNGPCLEIGVRKLEWISGGKRVLDAFISDYFVKEDENEAKYLYNTVPVVIHIYDDDVCITQCDTIVYESEFFKIPNPLTRFEQIYG